MRIALIALGSRGDVQPTLALGSGLRARGHEVTVVAGTNFEAWIRGYNLGYVPTIDQEALMRTPAGVAWVQEPNPVRQLQHMKSLLNQHSVALYSAVAEPAQNADLLLCGFVSEPFAQAASERFSVPMINATLQPYRPTRSGAASLTPILPGRRSILNLLSGTLASRLIWSVGGEATNRFRRELGLPPLNAVSYLRTALRAPTIYGFSRHVVPPADDWGDNVHIAGYWFLDAHTDWQPPADVARFLDDGEPPIYVGFGSMPSADPQATHDLIRAALRQTGLRAVLAGGWGGAVDDTASDFAYFLDDAPHEWLFERVAAVVHHGGAGTTAAGLRAGKPTLIVPHLGDQPYWGRRVYELGVGAKPIPRQKLTVEALADGMRRITSDAAIQRKAADLGAQIRSEDGVSTAVELIERMAASQAIGV